LCARWPDAAGADRDSEPGGAARGVDSTRLHGACVHGFGNTLHLYHAFRRKAHGDGGADADFGFVYPWCHRAVFVFMRDFAAKTGGKIILLHRLINRLPRVRFYNTDLICE
jgi:hypothetical protein